MGVGGGGETVERGGFPPAHSHAAGRMCKAREGTGVGAAAGDGIDAFRTGSGEGRFRVDWGDGWVGGERGRGGEGGGGGQRGEVPVRVRRRVKSLL